jgi:hypothetical protein
MEIIDNPSDYFNTGLLTGNGSTQSVTGVNFQPDWVWLIHRADTYGHRLANSVTNTLMFSNANAPEEAVGNSITSFNSDGFSVGTDGGSNISSGTFVSWNWKAGTSFTNDASATGIGTVDSAGSVNTDAGFSITKFTADGNNLTAAHGLGVAPTMILTKNLSITKNWSVYHSSLGAGKSIFLNTTAVADTDNTYWNNTAPTSTTLSYGTWSGNNNGNEIIAYCFAEKQGYSKFGSYTGNGSTDGTFVYTGFKPAWIMIKKTDGVENWKIWDNKRPGFNDLNYQINVNTSEAESDSANNRLDLVSNGFKMRGSGDTFNTSGGSYIFMCFAENPFTTSSGVPATAR